jgi:hypothetical protein
LPINIALYPRRPEFSKHCPVCISSGTNILVLFGTTGTNKWIMKYRPLLFWDVTWNMLADGY